MALHSKRKQSVVLVSGSFAPREGGAERQMRQVLEAVAPGMPVGVVTQALGGSPRHEILEYGLTIDRVGSLLAFRLFPRLGQGLFVAWAFVSLMRMRPAVILSLQLGGATLVGSVASRLLGVRHVVRLTGGGTDQYRSEPEARAASRVGKLVVKSLGGSHSIVVAPAQHLLDDFAEFFPGLACERVLIPNGVMPTPGPSPSKKREVVWYSRSGAERSSSTAFEVARALPAIRFTVIGVPSELNLLPNVDFLGWVEDPERIIGRHRVLLNTSRLEGMPNTALQALSLGVKVVGIENAGLLELRSKYSQHVYCVPPGDEGGLAEAVRQHVGFQSDGPCQVPSTGEVVEMWKHLCFDGAV